MLIENEVLNVRVVEEQKSSGLMNKMGDFCLGASLAILAAVLAEFVLKSESNIGIERVLFCTFGFLIMIAYSVVFYKKGGK